MHDPRRLHLRRPARRPPAARRDPDRVRQSHQSGHSSRGRCASGSTRQTGTATLLQSITDPDVPASNCCGSARRLGNGDWLIDWGQAENIRSAATSPTASRTFLLTFDRTLQLSRRAGPRRRGLGAGSASSHEREVFIGVPLTLRGGAPAGATVDGRPPSATTVRRLKRIGHKGADSIRPGNTLESFEAAVAAGVEMIELDVLRPRADFRDGGDWRRAAAGPATAPAGPLLVAHDWGDAARREPLTLDAGARRLHATAARRGRDRLRPEDRRARGRGGGRRFASAA